MSTTNLNLSTLAGSEKLKTFPSPYNDNMEAIDGAFGAGFGVGTNISVNQAINALADGLAIIANGDTHAAITTGQYVYVRNHGSLAEGLYIATANISANGTLSGSNLTADARGGLNSLFGSLSLLKTGVNDANDDLANGIYTCTSATQNIPSDGVYGVLMNMKSGGSTERRIQYLMYNTRLWCRFGAISSGSLSWTAWSEIISKSDVNDFIPQKFIDSESSTTKTITVGNNSRAIIDYLSNNSNCNFSIIAISNTQGGVSILEKAKGSAVTFNVQTANKIIVDVGSTARTGTFLIQANSKQVLDAITVS